MPRVLTYDRNKFIGAYKFPDRKKPCLCIQEGANIVVYGTFNTDKGATEFMNKLGECGLHSEPKKQRLYERWTVDVKENDYCSYGKKRRRRK